METSAASKSELSPDLIRQAAEEQVRLLSEVTQDYIWDWDVVGNFVTQNGHFKDALGEPPSDYLAAYEWWKARAHPEDIERITALYTTAREQGETRLSYEYRLRDLSGKYLTLDCRARLFPGTEGRWGRVLVSSRDITRRQRALEAQMRLISILEATTDFVSLATVDGELTFLNAAGRKMIGLGAEEPLTLRAADIHPDWAKQIVFEEAIPTAMRQGSWRGESAVQHRAGHEIPVSQVMLSHLGADGGVEFLSTIIRDLSDRKREEVAHIEWANRYDAAIRASGQVLFDWNSFTNEITYGGNTERMFGYGLPEMTGGLEQLRRLIHPDDLARVDERLKQIIATRDPFHLEFRVGHKTAGFVHIEAKGYFFLDRSGHIGRMVGFFADITAQRVAQDELALSRENLERRVTERTGELARASMVIEDRARQQEAVAQLGQRALSGLPFSALAEEAMRVIQKILKVDCASLLALTVDGSAFIVRSQVGWPEPSRDNRVPIGRGSQSGYTLLTGEPVIVDDCAKETRFSISEPVARAGLVSGLSVLIEGDEQPLGVLNAFTQKPRKFVQDDIHFLQTLANVLTAAIQRERSEESVRQAREQAEEASRAKSEFLSRMSHELRTPLNAILGFTQLLEIDDPSPAQIESIQHISRAGKHLLALINEVLDVSRVESGRLAMTSEPIDITEFLEIAISLIRPLARQHGIEIIEKENAARLPTRVLADRERLHQVMSNLLSNAVKYNRPGGRVFVSCGDEGSQLRIAVADTGLGIEPDKLARLFLPFERLGAEATPVQGSGIGLALSRGIIRALGGELEVQSRVGEGSTFSIFIPRLEQAATAPELSIATPTGGAPSTAREPRETYELLYIEDQDFNLRLVERILLAHPQYRLRTAMFGREGLELARALHPDLILLDLNLPDMSGDDVLRELKADPALQQVPVLMVSADAMGERVEQLLALGAAGYLTKPYKLAEFLRAIREVLTPAAEEVSSS